MVDEHGTLTIGQRCMLGLVATPSMLLMALSVLSDLLRTESLARPLVEVVLSWTWVLFLLTVAGWTGRLSLTGRAPGPRR